MPDWLFITAAVLLAVSGLATMGWALFADRAGRPRCPSCGYDMRQLRTFTCPECGRLAISKSGVFRARRRWRWAALGLLAVLLAPTVAAQPYARGETWTRAIPTWLLVVLYDTDEQPDATVINRALDNRLLHGGLSDWQLRWLERREFKVTPEDLAHVVTSRATWPRPSSSPRA